MPYIIACLMASLSFLLNRAALKRMGVKVVISFGPAVEELSKTMLSYLLNADILLTHILFGIIEAGYDFRASGSHKIGAAAASIIGHTLFGLVTVMVLEIGGSIWLSLISAYLLHLLWNVLAVLLTRFRKGRTT